MYRIHKRKLFSWLNGWTVATSLVAVTVAIPIATVLLISLTPNDDIWEHLVATVLPLYIGTTLQLMLGVGFGSIFIGVGTAWLVSMCRFPGKNVFEWALLLPLAVPAYVVAYIYTDILEYAGPVQSMLRDTYGWTTKSDYWFPEIRSIGGAISMMTLVLYPYVYLLSRAAFLEQSVCVLEASRVLGQSPTKSFFSVALPLTRPAIVIGVSLVLMETLNDFGTVDFFAVSTFTLGIYDVWLNMNNIAGAAQLAGTLLLFVIFLITIERINRRKQRFHNITSKFNSLPGYSLVGTKRYLATACCALPIIFGFVVPICFLVGLSSLHFDIASTTKVLRYAGNSLFLSSLAAGMAIAVGIIMAYGARLTKGRFLVILVRVASMGYAIPGSVLAVGVLASFGMLDNSIDSFMKRNLGISSGLIFSGTILAVTFGYLVRFLALAFGAIEASLSKITVHMDGASRSLGHSPMSTLRNIHFPLMRGSVLAALILVFVDCMRELPMTVILRPFNFHTLATHVHQFAMDEQFGEASFAALAIVGFGILPVIVLSYAITRSRPGTTNIDARL